VSVPFVSSPADQPPGLELLTDYGLFERYNEQAQRAIFFARYEASQFGTKAIESEHLLLGILHEHWRLSDRLHQRNATGLEIRKEIEQRKPARTKTPTSADLPLSTECSRAMTFAAEEARLMKHAHIGNEHLLVGLLREQKCLAAELLRAHGIDLEESRKDLTQGGTP
jgi:ATP-dependent Clp protease ATP-binding subunit ClpC